MSILTSRRRLVAVAAGLTIAAAIVGGCGDYRAYRGAPEGFSTHPFRILYPYFFVVKKLPQMKRNVLELGFLFYDIPVSREQPKAPPMIMVRCHRMRERDTAQTFVERHYDDLAARYLNLKLRRLSKGPSGTTEYILSVAEPYHVIRVIPLPREGIAYTVETLCTPQERRQWEEILRKARDSFTLLPVPR